MKILVLGKNGMLGHVVYQYFLEKKYNVVGTSRTKNDIFYDAYYNMESLNEIIKEEKPDVVINCIGVLNQSAEDNKVLAVKVNSLLPHYIDQLSEKYNFKFIHVSTDCVFDGKKGKYDEQSFSDATSFYGRSKALGEINNEKSITLRTSIIGPDINSNGIGLFQWFMNQNEKANGYTKVIWTGVTTIELAKIMEVSIKKNLTGLHHVVNNDFISKYDLLKLFSKMFEKEIEIIPYDNIESSKTLIRTEKSYNFIIPSYEEMLKEMERWMKNHKVFYKNMNMKGK